MEGYSLKQFVDEYRLLHQNLYCETNIDELLCSDRMIILRSAKAQVLIDLLDKLLDNQYKGNILLIGREGDCVYREQYSKLNIDVYIVKGDEKYREDLLDAVIDEYKPDAMCMLYQSTISLNHLNLFEVLSVVRCKRYGVSNKTEIIRFNSLKKYVCGTKIYQEFCDWMSLELED